MRSATNSRGHGINTSRNLEEKTVDDTCVLREIRNGTAGVLELDTSLKSERRYGAKGEWTNPLSSDELQKSEEKECGSNH